MANKKLIQGNEACVEGALAAGVRFFAGYPITPSTEIAEGMAERLPLVGGAFIQMEDEIASIAAAIGASIAGVKAMTATSGPGFSLMQENIGFAAMTEIPVVVVDVCRGGPSTGTPTKGSQSDFMQTRWGTHGDHPVIVLTPSSVQEVYDETIRAFNLAEKYMVPVILLYDEVVGHMREGVVLTKPEEIIERKKPSVKPEDYRPYAAAEDMIPALAPFGTGYRYHITGLSHDETGFPTGNPKTIQGLLERICGKIEANRHDIIKYNAFDVDDAEAVILAFGSPVRTARHVQKEARARGKKVGLFQILTAWPFPHEALQEIYAKTQASFVIPEMTLGQLADEVSKSVPRDKIYSVLRNDGEMITPAQLEEAVRRVLE
ncbi:MAG TPA: 2-oxoacid:acceptor oxidoreductase subunit alpha [Bacillota bacterium]|nr:2-oxoacid:acceptor oxidoreductase subunit alpha [Bacillota bacterium]HQE01012.1 2-oxoacid:acceptor oxidoreductase subunit alpha [Bacillota bacterium]